MKDLIGKIFQRSDKCHECDSHLKTRKRLSTTETDVVIGHRAGAWMSEGLLGQSSYEPIYRRDTVLLTSTWCGNKKCKEYEVLVIRNEKTVPTSNDLKKYKFEEE